MRCHRSLRLLAGGDVRNRLQASRYPIESAAFPLTRACLMAAVSRRAVLENVNSGQYLRAD